MKLLKLINLNYLLVFFPLSLLAAYFNVGDSYVFIASFIAIIPLAKLIGWATEELTLHTGPNIGGLLNATFGNATELILAIVALNAGLIEVVKATITGSIISNLLLVLGFSMFLGGWKNKEQLFNTNAASVNSLMLLIPVTTLMLPTVTNTLHPDSSVQMLSVICSVILLVLYAASLTFMLVTHQHLFEEVAMETIDPAEHQEEASGSIWKWVGILAAITIGVAVESELLVHSFEPATEALGLPYMFTSVILLPIIGNAAEHASAVTVAMKNKMDLSLGIAIGSSTQIAMFVAPILVIIGWIIGQPMDLNFSLLEVVALTISVALVGNIINDGKSNWLEGLSAMLMYIAVAAMFFFV